MADVRNKQTWCVWNNIELMVVYKPWAEVLILSQRQRAGRSLSVWAVQVLELRNTSCLLAILLLINTSTNRPGEEELSFCPQDYWCAISACCCGRSANSTADSAHTTALSGRGQTNVHPGGWWPTGSASHTGAKAVLLAPLAFSIASTWRKWADTRRMWTGCRFAYLNDYIHTHIFFRCTRCFGVEGISCD